MCLLFRGLSSLAHANSSATFPTTGLLHTSSFAAKPDCGLFISLCVGASGLFFRLSISQECLFLFPSTCWTPHGYILHIFFHEGFLPIPPFPLSSVIPLVAQTNLPPSHTYTHVSSPDLVMECPTRKATTDVYKLCPAACRMSSLETSEDKNSPYSPLAKVCTHLQDYVHVERHSPLFHTQAWTGTDGLAAALVTRPPAFSVLYQVTSLLSEVTAFVFASRLAQCLS